MMRRQLSTTGSAMAMVLISFTVLSMVVASVLLRTMNNYHTLAQVGSWQEALLAAESAVDTAMGELRKTIFAADQAWTGWSVTAADGSILPHNGRRFTPATLIHDGEGNTELTMAVIVDAPPELLTADGLQWYRIKATGVTYLPGSHRVSSDKRDNLLRKFSLVWDRRTGTAVTRPHASRLVEIVARPIGFEDALTANGLITLNNHNIIIDSYDSRDSDKSTNSKYDPAKRQENGNVATNGQIIEANNAHIYGDAYTNAGVVTGAANITGEQRNDYYQELLPIKAPAWTSIDATPAWVDKTLTLTGGTRQNPKRYKFTSVNLTGNESILMTPSASGVDSYTEVWITGDLKSSGNAGLWVKPNASVKVYVEGNVDITGNGVINENETPRHFLLFGIQPPPQASTPAIKVAGNGTFIGGLYAPNHNVSLSGGGSNGNYWGSIYAKTITMNGSTEVHFDEALAQSSFVNDYKIVSWFEDDK